MSVLSKMFFMFSALVWIFATGISIYCIYITPIEYISIPILAAIMCFGLFTRSIFDLVRCWRGY